MTAPEVWMHLWAVCLAYPAQAIAFVVVVFGLGNVVALCLVSMGRPELPLHQWEDDDEQARAVSRPVSLETWRRSGAGWTGKQ
jgi:hypothetical protein